MKTNLKVATAQFENKDGDKSYNLSKIEQLSANAARDGAQVILFHECSVTGLTHAMNLTYDEMVALAEFVEDGPSVKELQRIANVYNITILAGLFEKDNEGRLYKTQVCVNENGLVAKFRKLHPFINRHLTPGSAYCIFELYGWKCSILICYDNNIIENVRATALLGAEILFMPHVTMLTPSPRPGAGFVDPALWYNREYDQTSLRAEFDGLKGRSWLMKWLPARAYDNGIYVVFSNAIGLEGGQLKNGCSMALDPFGDIIAECRYLGDDVALATFVPEKIAQSGGQRYRNARRTQLYASILSQQHDSVQQVAWKHLEQGQE